MRVSRLLSRSASRSRKLSRVIRHHHTVVQLSRCFSTRAALTPSSARRIMQPPSDFTDIDFNKLTIELNTNPKKKPALETLEFGVSFTDHLLQVDWKKGEGWGAPGIVPYTPFQMDPAASVLHYALECFEGMKAYIGANKEVLLFRPEMNMKRFQRSCNALAFPEFDADHFEECLRELVRVDRDWIPDKAGYSMYLRPTAISMDPRVKVMPSGWVRLYVIMCPVGPYYSGGFKPVRLYADDKHVRAWEGGCGASKLGANYGPTIAPAMEAAKKGCDQVLWLYGNEKYVTEAGAMNQFFHWINEEGEKELITAPLGDVILPGITRDSILHLAKGIEGVGKVSERQFTIDDVCKASREGRMLESFGAGTAAIVSPTKCIHYKDEDFDIPCGESGIGPLAKQFMETITGIQTGAIPHEWAQVIDTPKELTH